LTNVAFANLIHFTYFKALVVVDTWVLLKY